MNKDNFFYVPIDEASKPATGEVIVNNYWMFHPEKGIMFFYGHGTRPYPQCNPDKKVSEIIKKKPVYEDCDIVHVPSVYMSNIKRFFEMEKERRKNNGPKI